jgi:hypothetical protein
MDPGLQCGAYRVIRDRSRTPPRKGRPECGFSIPSGVRAHQVANEPRAGGTLNSGLAQGVSAGRGYGRPGCQISCETGGGLVQPGPPSFQPRLYMRSKDAFVVGCDGQIFAYVYSVSQLMPASAIGRPRRF